MPASYDGPRDVPADRLVTRLVDAIREGPTADDQTGYSWAKNEQGYEGTYEQWQAMPAAERAEYEAGAQGIGTV